MNDIKIGKDFIAQKLHNGAKNFVYTSFQKLPICEFEACVCRFIVIGYCQLPESGLHEFHWSHLKDLSKIVSNALVMLRSYCCTWIWPSKTSAESCTWSWPFKCASLIESVIVATIPYNLIYWLCPVCSNYYYFPSKCYPVRCAGWTNGFRACMQL